MGGCKDGGDRDTMIDAVGGHDAIRPALLLSLWALVGVSLLTPRPDLAHLAPLAEA